MIKSILMLFSSSILSSVLTLVTQAIIASELGPDSFGVFSSSLALVMLLCPIIAMGSDGYFLKFTSGVDDQALQFNSNWVLYFIITSILMLIIYFMFESTDTGKLALLMISQSLMNFCVAVFQSKKKYLSVSVILTLQSLSRISALGLFILYYEIITLENIVALYFFVSLLMIMVCFFVLYQLEFGVLYFKYKNITYQGFIAFLKSSMPFGVTTLLHLVYFQSDIIVIDKLYSSEDAGIYSAAFVVLTAAYMIPSVIYQKYFLPIAHQLAALGPIEREYLYFIKGTKYMFLFALISMGVVYMSSDWIVSLVYGEEYSESSMYIKVLSICIIFRFLSSNAGVFLMTRDLVHKKNKYMFVCAILNIVLNVIFVPFYGAIAAAITTIVTEFLLCSLFYWGIKTHKFPNLICE